MLVNSGLTKVLNLMSTGMYIAVGTGTTAEAATQTALTTELARSAVAVATVNGSTDITYSAFFTSTQVGGQTVREIGIFDAAAAGNMLTRSLKTQAVASNNGLIVEITVPIERAD